MTPREAFDALMYEGVPTRPSAPDPLRMQYGPSEQFRRLLVERDKWRALNELATDDELEEETA